VRQFLLVLFLIGAACGVNDATDNASEWIHVLNRKKAAVSPKAGPRQKQIYADSLGAFVTRYPSHSRAREVYRRVQLDFARELASLGRYQDSIRFYRAVLSDDPQNREALAGIAAAFDRLTVTRQKLLALEKGMSQRDVAHLLGKPAPGWMARTERPDCTIDAWYYRTSERGVAGVYFRDGSLFAAEESSHAKLVPLMQPATR